ncbi:MAG TPA: hypothetical protein VGE12_09960 [Noviherbaspirillum sp.]
MAPSSVIPFTVIYTSMDIGLLLLLNLSTVPFLTEFEHITCERKQKAKLGEVIALRKFRKQRWAWGFGLLWMLFLTLALAPSASGKTYPVTLKALAAILLLQIGVWGYAAYRAKRSLASHTK